MTLRERLSATVEGELLEAARQAVRTGRAGSVSAWVNDAMRRQADHDRRIEALDEFFAEYEAEHGTITEQEMREATQRAHARAVVTGADVKTKAHTRRRRGAA